MLAAVAPIAVYLAVSGLDDLFVDLAWLVLWMRGRLHRSLPTPADLDGSQRRIAIFVPLWHEHEVIGPMLAHNIAAIRYAQYDFFVGAYPNDAATLAAVREIEARFANVHLAVCPHDGPTSKADCLNWVYQQMLVFEEEAQRRFELILTHDAEDIIHPESLSWFNYYARDYDFIQLPVLALRTPLFEWTHGIYCDEFSEFHMRDLPVRNRLGGFLPSAGVGTAYSRQALEALAEAESNRIFEPAALTEDYENGRRLHQLGFAQIFLPPLKGPSGYVATREFFPRHWRAAIRQRTRWVMGIALQGWQLHGWSGGRRQLYWLWRDRKGLIGAPLSVVTNVLTTYSAATHLWAQMGSNPITAGLCWFTLLLQILRLGIRMGCVGQVYGWRLASLAPLRTIFGNFINAAAVMSAFWRYGRARWRNQPLVWVKTAHSYPSRAALATHRRKIGEILVGSAYVAEPDFARALASQPAGLRIGEHLMGLGLLGEEELYEALSIQQGVPLGAPRDVSPAAARTLPAHVLREWRVLPFQVAAGKLFVAGPDLPTDALHLALSQYTALEVRFHLVTPTAFAAMNQRR